MINEKLIFSDVFIETTYLWCYKRLNSKADAEDLAQDILFNALKSIRFKREIHCFLSWYWQMAHKRYCVFLQKKNKQSVSLEVFGGTVASSPISSSINEELMSKEEISELNFAISRLSAVHREIIIMFYLKEIPIKEIAKHLDIPEGTVKRRLFDAKKNIRKELDTMNMNIGKSSYAPATLNKWGGYMIPKHWETISGLINDQIFISCANEAKSINEISNEIGVAPVYLEESIKKFLELEFLKESTKGKYLTDFVIMPAESRSEFYYQSSIVYNELGEEMTDALYSVEDEIRSAGFYGNDFEFSYLLWILYVFACTSFSHTALSIYRKQWAKENLPKYKKEYRIAGTVLYPDEKLESRDVKVVGWSNLHNNFSNDKYKSICYANLFQSEPFGDRDKLIDGANTPLLLKLAENPAANLSEWEQEQAAAFIRVGVIKKQDDKLIVNIPIMTSKEIDCKVLAAIEKAINPLVAKYVDKIAKLGDEILLPTIRKDLLEEYVNWIMEGAFFPIGYVLYYAMYEGKTLEIPEDYKASAAALYLRLEIA